MSWDSHRSSWERVPVEDTETYEPAAGMLAMTGAELAARAGRIEAARYGGWRNWNGLWRQMMGTGEYHGSVLDYGCGFGIEALQYAKAGNEVSVADINLSSVQLAVRVLAVHGHTARRMLVIDPGPPFIKVPPGSFDLVAMNGVLHHIEDPVPVVREAARWLRPGGQLRVMVYTDVMWREITGTEPPADVTGHPARHQFVSAADRVGDWADWYDAGRLEARFGEWFRLAGWSYLREDSYYGAGILERKP